MKKTYILCLITFIFCVFSLSGCQESAKKNKAVKSATTNSSKFPAFLVGTWESNSLGENVLEFTFDANGDVVSLRNPMNTYIVVADGGALEQPPESNDVYAATTLGPIDVNYECQSRTLMVKVVTDSFVYHIHNEILEGNSVDIFTGQISSDNKIWTANWQNTSRITDIPHSDTNDVNTVIFHKVR